MSFHTQTTNSVTEAPIFRLNNRANISFLKDGYIYLRVIVPYPHISTRLRKKRHVQPRGNKFMRRSIFSVLAICALIALSMLSLRFFPVASPAFGEQSRHTATMPIKHIVFIVKENHSFDNYFGL